MPIRNIEQGPKTLSPCDVVGERAGGQTRFVKHVGLFDEDSRSVNMGGIVWVLHMGPPIGRNTINAHTAGHISLNNNQIKRIRTWYAKVEDEAPSLEIRQYVIRPAWKNENDPNTGVKRYRRYSCAGFVLDAHRQVKIELLDIDESKLPEVYRKTLKHAYPDFEKHPKLLRYWGIEGNGPWKVVLAGYVLHALDRTSDQIRQGPYRAKEGDEQF